MHRYLICSDIHSKVESFVQALEVGRAEGVEAVFIAGDLEFEPEKARRLVSDIGAELYCVRGNCDYNTELQTVEIIDLPDARVLLTHGHRFGVKQNLYGLYELAKDNAATLAIYGHTHLYDDHEYYGLRVINPGALAGSYFESAGFVLMTIDDGEIEVERVEVE